MTLGPFLLLAPLALAGLLALPIIWYILRSTPPAPIEAELPSLRLCRIGVECDAHLRPRSLDFRHVDSIAPDQQLIVAGADKISRVSWRVSRSRYSGYTRKDLAAREQPHTILVGRNLLSRALKEKAFCAFVRFGHIAIVQPVLGLVLVCDEFSILEEWLAGLAIGQAGGMVRMHVRQQDRIDVGGLDASCS